MDYQDVLAKVGAGTAHPGGYMATKDWVNALQWDSRQHVLEVGCGTGRTLTDLVRRFGCRATGVDIRETMIEKAVRRSQVAGVEVDWSVASADHLPIESESVDVLITESVNVFVQDVAATLQEYRRVLKPSGCFVDIEMFLRAPVDAVWKQRAKAVYGVMRVPDQPSWKRLFRAAGFQDVKVMSSYAVEPGAMVAADDEDADMASPDAYQDPEVIAILTKNASWMEENYTVLGFATYICRPCPIQ